MFESVNLKIRQSIPFGNDKTLRLFILGLVHTVDSHNVSPLECHMLLFHLKYLNFSIIFKKLFRSHLKHNFNDNIIHISSAFISY